MADQAFVTLIQYILDPDPNRPTLEIDSKALVLGVQALGALPISAKSNGQKCIVVFYKDEVIENVNKIMLFLAGIYDQPLFIDYGKYLKADQGWQNLMGLQRNVGTPNESRYKR